MGSSLSLSRSKKIAPVCVVEINVSKRETESPEETVAPAPRSPGDVRNSFRRFKFPNFTNGSNFSKVDFRRRGSPRSTEKDDAHRGKPERTPAACDDEHGNISKTKNGHNKKSFVRSRTYGLCTFKRVSSNTELNPTTTPSQAFTSSNESRRQECGWEDVNKNGNSVFSHVRKHAPAAGSDHEHRGLGPSRSCVEQVLKTGNDSSFANCLNTPVTTPVILYDGSEEELMDTIEREFS
ncbi:unnamed protein product [Arctogadus glacialis]